MRCGMANLDGWRTYASYCGVHVEAIVVVASDKDSLTLQEKLRTFFPVDHFGVMAWYIGCSFERDTVKGTLKITQLSQVLM